MKIALLVAALLVSPAFAHDQWANGGKIPDWVKGSCCGPADAHHLTPDQVHDMGDYYIVDGYHESIKKTFANGALNSSILPSQDGQYWIFYKDEPAGEEACPECTKSTHHDARQSGVYCFFVVLAF